MFFINRNRQFPILCALWLTGVILLFLALIWMDPDLEIARRNGVVWWKKYFGIRQTEIKFCLRYFLTG